MRNIYRHDTEPYRRNNSLLQIFYIISPTFVSKGYMLTPGISWNQRFLYSSSKRVTSFSGQYHLRDWSLITGGATKWENCGSETFCAPPSRQGSTFRAPPFKEWKLFAHPPYNMAKTSSYHVKTTPKTFCAPPPSAWLKLFPRPLFVGVKLHVPPPPPPRN